MFDVICLVNWSINVHFTIHICDHATEDTYKHVGNYSTFTNKHKFPKFILLKVANQSKSNQLICINGKLIIIQFHTSIKSFDLCLREIKVPFL